MNGHEDFVQHVFHIFMVSLADKGNHFVDLHPVFNESEVFWVAASKLPAYEAIAKTSLLGISERIG
jgi:hypothetical protein